MGFSAAHLADNQKAVPDAGRLAAYLSDLAQSRECESAERWRMAELGDAGIARRTARIVGFEIVVAGALSQCVTYFPVAAPTGPRTGAKRGHPQLHLVVQVEPALAQQWSDTEVTERSGEGAHGCAIA